MKLPKQDEITSKVGNWIKPRFKSFERSMIFMIFLSFALYLQQISFSEILLGISMIFSSLIYFLYSYGYLEDKYLNGPNNFIKYFSNWSYSIMLIGLFFLILQLHGYETMITISLMTLFLVISFSSYQLYKEKEISEILKPTIVRSVIFMIVGLFFIITPKEELVKYKIIQTEIIDKKLN